MAVGSHIVGLKEFLEQNKNEEEFIVPDFPGKIELEAEAFKRLDYNLFIDALEKKNGASPNEAIQTSSDIQSSINTISKYYQSALAANENYLKNFSASVVFFKKT